MIGIPLKRTMSRTRQEAPIVVILYIRLKTVRPHTPIDIAALYHFLRITHVSILGLSPFETTGDDQEVALVGGLHPAVTYTFRIFAINSIDASGPTEPVVAKTQEEGKCLI